MLAERVIQGIGLYRVRARLVNGDELYLLERFEWIDDAIQVGKYAFHWQRADGALIRRWDNAPHHPEIATFPDHLHEGSEDTVLPHAAVDSFRVLRMVEAALSMSLNPSSTNPQAPRTP